MLVMFRASSANVNSNGFRAAYEFIGRIILFELQANSINHDNI